MTKPEQLAAAGSAPEPDWLAPPESLQRPGAVKAALAVAEALFAAAEGPPPRARLEWLGRELDDFLERIGLESRGSYLLGLWGLSMLGPLLLGRFRPLGRLSLAQRIEALSRVEASAFSGVLLVVKAMLCILYYEHPEAALEIGVDGRCLGRL